MYCEKCGSQMDDGTKFCVSCGAKIESNGAGQEDAVREAAAVMDSTVAKEAVSQQQAAPVQPAPAQPKQAQQSQPAPAQPVPPRAVQPPVYTQQAPQPLQKKPASTAPLPVWKFLGIFILMSIPIVGIIMVFVWAFGSSCNINTKHYARAVLIMAVIAIVLTVVGYFTVWASVSEILQDIMPSSGMM